MADAVTIERRIVTVLFADLVGFTTISEHLEPEDIATVQDAYFGMVRETIGRYGGVLEKFIGDAAMAVFGAPRARDDDAERAVRAGLALVSGVERLGSRLGLEHDLLRVRVGVNSGEVIHATDGPDAGRVTGDTVNTAARLQTAARPNAVLLGELTALTVSEAVELGERVDLELKGKAKRVIAHEAVAVRPEGSRDQALGGLRAPIIGRDAELAQLERMLDEHGPARLTIIAPPGVGKSRLVSELEARATARGVIVLRARARLQAAPPFEAIAQLLVSAGARDRLGAALAGSNATAGRRAVLQDEVANLLQRTDADPEGAVRDLAAERDARFAAWSEALDALAGPAPSLWIVEDVHWAGPDLLAFLERAADGGTGRHRVVVATARPSLLETARDWTQQGEMLQLSTLPAVAAEALVTALVGDALPGELVASIAQRSDGNPLFVEELLRTWVSVGMLGRGEDGSWRLAVAPDEVALPATVQAIYAAQLDDLPADARQVARRASVAGRRFSEGALSPLGLDEQRPGLETLRRRAFVRGPDHDLDRDDIYAFRHALLRDAGYASLARLERARLHAALARWLDATAGARRDSIAQSVAQHYADAASSVPLLGADEPGLTRSDLAIAAAGAFERAAGASVAVAAHEEAVRLLRRSIEHTPTELTADLARRRLRLGEILADVADLDEGIGEMSAAVEALEPLLPLEAATYAQAAYRLGLAYMQQIRFHETEALTLSAIERVGEADVAGTLRLRALHAWSVSAQGRDEGAGDEARRALSRADELGDPSVEIDVLEHYAATLDEIEQPDHGAWARLESLARQRGRWRQVAIAARARAVMLGDTDPARALVDLSEAAEVAEAHGMTEQLGWLRFSRCETLWLLGRWDEALDSADQAISLGERYGYDRLVFRTWMVVLPLLAARQDPAWLPRYERWWLGAQLRFPPSPSTYGLVLRAATARWVALAGGAEPGARPPAGGLAEEIPLMSNPHFMAAVETLVEWWLSAGQTATARVVGARCRAAVEAGDTSPLLRVSSALIEAWIARVDGDDAASRVAAGRAATDARAIGAPWWEARALSVAGRDAEAINHELGIVGARRPT